MNARHESPEVLAAVADPLDPLELDTSTALTAPTREALTITEVLDAAPKDEKGRTITSIAPIKFDVTDTLLASLRAELTGARFDVKSADGMKAAKATVSKLTKLKTGIETAFTDWNKPVRALQKKAGEQRDYAVAEILKLREPIAEQVDTEQAEIDRIKAQAAVAESRRIEAHVGALKLLQDLAPSYVAASVADIEAAVADLSRFDYLAGRNWEEYSPAALDAQRAAIDALGVHLTNARAREELAAVRAQQQREADERAAAEAAAETERERIAFLRERITNIQVAPTTCIGLPAAQIQRTLDRVLKVDASDFAEFATEATEAIDAARGNLQTMLDAANAAEADARDAAEFRAYKAQQAAKAQADAEQDARIKREAEEREARLKREADERDARIQREAEERAARIEREAAERMRASAGAMRDLLAQARPYLAIAEGPAAADLLADIDAMLAQTAGEQA